jgi:hypothetical protein
MSDPDSGKKDSIPELMKPSVAGPYVRPKTDGKGIQISLPAKPVEPPKEETPPAETPPPVPQGNKATEEKPVPDEPTKPSEPVKEELLPSDTPPPGPKGILPLEVKATESKPVEPQPAPVKEKELAPVEKAPVRAEAEKIKEIEDAFARRKEGTAPGRNDPAPTLTRGDLSKDKDGRLTLAKLERTGRKSQKTKAKVHLEPAKPEGEGAAPKKKFQFRYGWEIGAVLAAIAVIIAGVFIYLGMRETRFKVAVVTDTVQVEPEAWIVYDFSDRIDFIRGDLERRKLPYAESIKEVDASLSAAKADLAGREARLRLLREALEQDQAEIPKIVEEQQAALREIWEKEGPRLDQEYENRKAAINKQIEDRARQIGIKFERNEELDAPEVSVNAFRLGLYNIPEGVDGVAERQWVEEILRQWKVYEEEFTKKQDVIRDKAIALRQAGAPKVEVVQERVDARLVEINQLQEEMKEFVEEVKRHETTKTSITEELAGLVGPFVEDLSKVPVEYIHLRWPLENGRKLDVRRLEKEPALPPGSYQLLIRGHREGEPVWAQKELVIEEFKTTELVFGEKDFVKIRSFLEDKK